MKIDLSIGLWNLKENLAIVYPCIFNLEMMNLETMDYSSDDSLQPILTRWRRWNLTGSNNSTLRERIKAFLHSFEV